MKKNIQSMPYCHTFKSDILLIIIYKGIFMKKVSIFIVAILSIFLKALKKLILKLRRIPIKDVLRH